MPQAVLGFNWLLSDDDDGGSYDSRLLWLGQGTYQADAGWGHLRLSDLRRVAFEQHIHTLAYAELNCDADRKSYGDRNAGSRASTATATLTITMTMTATPTGTLTPVATSTPSITPAATNESTVFLPLILRRGSERPGMVPGTRRNLLHLFPQGSACFSPYNRPPDPHGERFRLRAASARE